jgi:hypothetical protein
VLIGCLQFAHFPPSASQLTTGMFCSAVIGALQPGQAERGTIRLYGCGSSAFEDASGLAAGASPAASIAHSARSSFSIITGTRWITTLRKLPTSRPTTTQMPM